RPTVHAERERTGDRGRRPVLQYRLEWQDAPRGRKRGREEPTDDGGWKGRGSRHDREDRDPGLHERRFGEKTASGLVPVGEEEERQDEEREQRQGDDDMAHAEAEGEGHRPGLRRHAIHSPPRSAAAAR